MANNKKNRSELKSYFVKNSIPTESNFADLIDGMLNLQDDRIFKLPGDPLSIEATGDATGLQKVINFYTKFEDPNAPNPAWSLQLNPQTDANGSKTSNAGFCVADGQSGVPRLFIDKKTGHLGLGTILPGAKLDIVADSVISFQGWNEAIRLSNKDNSAITHPDGGLLFGLHGTGKFYFADTNKQKYLMVIDANNSGQVSIGTGGAVPIAKLDIAQAARSGTHPTAVKGLYITGDFGIDTDGVEFRHSNGTQGIGFGFASIYATGSNTDQVLQLKPRGAGALRILGKANISDGSNLDAVENQMASGSLTIGSTSSNYGGGNNWNASTAGLLLQTLANTEIAVHDANTRITSLMYYEGDTVNKITIGRDMAWGVTPVTIASNLTVNGAIFAGNSDVYFSKTNHNHTGTGNTQGMAAIENAASHNCLMILGRTMGRPGAALDRRVELWDSLKVNGAFVNNSDRNAKKDIEDLPYGLAAVRKLRPVSFNWKEIYNPHKSLGLIAQDVQEVIAEVIYEDDSDARKGALGVSYINLIPVLINAIKELDAKINR